jgi:MFS family permease
VATALVNIASSLGSYEAFDWVVVSYMLTYTGSAIFPFYRLPSRLVSLQAGFMIVYARLSDIYGRKPALLAAVGIFGLFSLGCGLASEMRTLIILRAFQEMGASGIYSMVFAVMPEIVPLQWFSMFSGMVGAVYACSSILGPTLGGVIINHASWRWVFLLK